jgi:hypothetical protein
MQTVAQIRAQLLAAWAGTIRTDRQPNVNISTKKKEKENNFRLCMYVSLQQTQTFQQANESVNNNNIHKPVLQCEGFFQTMINNIM